jgi:hypothetical protein
MQSISTSNGANHSGMQTKIRAGGTRRKGRGKNQITPCFFNTSIFSAS